MGGSVYAIVHPQKHWKYWTDLHKQVGIDLMYPIYPFSEGV